MLFPSDPLGFLLLELIDALFGCADCETTSQCAELTPRGRSSAFTRMVVVGCAKSPGAQQCGCAAIKITTFPGSRELQQNVRGRASASGAY